MSNVYIAGMGATVVGEHYQRSLADLASEAARTALMNVPSIAPHHIGALYVGSAFSEELYGQSQLGAYLASMLGLSPSIPALRVEAAGASGALALYQAVQAVQHGLPVALVIGVEKVTDHLEDEIEAAQAMATDSNEEALHGVTLTAQWAMLMRRYMYEYGYSADAFAPFPINAHANGAKNPLALYRFPIDASKYRKAAQIASPINMLDCSTLADGAAALLIVNENLARELDGVRIRIAGAAVATDHPALHRRRNPLDLSAARASAHIALGRAHLGVGDVDVWELTDPHGIAATLALEAIGCYETRYCSASCCRGSDYSRRKDTNCDGRWLQSPWRCRWCHRYLPGHRGCPTTSWSGWCYPSDQRSGRIRTIARWDWYNRS